MPRPKRGARIVIVPVGGRAAAMLRASSKQRKASGSPAAAMSRPRRSMVIGEVAALGGEPWSDVDAKGERQLPRRLARGARHRA
jgi:hypothetical protein